MCTVFFFTNFTLNFTEIINCESLSSICRHTSMQTTPSTQRSSFTQKIFFGGIVLSQETILFRMLLIRVDQSLVFFDEIFLRSNHILEMLCK